MNNTLVGLFAQRTDAESAVQDLTSAGFPRSEIRLLGSMSDSGMSDLTTLGVPQEHAHLYHEAVRVGGTLVVITAESSKAASAQAIMDRDGAIEPYAAAASTATTDTGGDTLEIVEERLQVGKREVETGGVRIRSFVTEKAVSEQISLHEEHVDVTRVKVDRPATDADFKEGTIEMRETAEVPVVAKEARVVEEISLGKTATDRVETVSDTVRRTDVEIVPIGTATSVGADHGASFASHLETVDPSASYERHAPAYAYGSALANGPTAGAADFDEAEDAHKDTWEKANPGTWDEFKASVKHAYEAVKAKI